MPKSGIQSTEDDGPGRASPVDRYVEPHERKAGPWHDHELEDAGRTIERAEQIKGNAKMSEAVAKHHAKKATHHRALAKSMRGHMARGMVSEKALSKAAGKHRG